MTIVSGLTILPPNHIAHFLKAEEIFTVNITPKAIQDIPHSQTEFSILEIRLNQDMMELDVGYIYGGGDGRALKAYCDFQRSNTVLSDVHIYLERETPSDMRIKGRYFKDTIKISLGHPCFLPPVAIHLHHVEFDKNSFAMIEKTTTIQRN